MCDTVVEWKTPATSTTGEHLWHVLLGSSLQHTHKWLMWLLLMSDSHQTESHVFVSSRPAIHTWQPLLENQQEVHNLHLWDLSHYIFHPLNMLQISSNLPKKSRLVKQFTNMRSEPAWLYGATNKTKSRYLDMIVFQWCKDKSVVCLTGESLSCCRKLMVGFCRDDGSSISSQRVSELFKLIII